MLKGGFDVNQQDIYGRTPLHWAAQMLDDELFTLLVEAGADIHIKSKVVSFRIFSSISPIVWKNTHSYVFPLYGETIYCQLGEGVRC